MASIHQDGTLHLDLTDRVAQEQKDRQIAAAHVYMDTLTKWRARGASYDEASVEARGAFNRALEGRQ